MLCTETSVYILFKDKTIHKVDANDFSADPQLKVAKLAQLGAGKGDITAMDLSGQELWVGDSAGNIYILDAETLEPLQKDGNLIEL